MKNIAVITNYFYRPTEEFLSWVNDNIAWVKLVNGGNTYPLQNALRDTHADINWALNELTALFTVVDDLDCLGKNIDIIGLQNYRRVFNKNDFKFLDTYDGLVSKTISLACIDPIHKTIIQPNILQQYIICHNKDDFKHFTEVCSKFEWFTEKIFLTWIQQKYLNSPYNTFCFNKKVFNLYVKDLKFFINNIIQLISLDEIAKRDDYQRRAIAFLCERFFSFWCYSMSTTYQMKFKDVNIEFHKNWKADLTADSRGQYKRSKSK